MLDHMQPKEASQDKEETQRGQKADAHAVQEKQIRCPTPGLPSSSYYTFVALLFLFSQLPVKLLVCKLLYKLARCLFLVTNITKTVMSTIRGRT